MRALFVVLAALAAGCKLPANVYYQCETDGGCAVEGTVCMADGVCRPPAGADAGADAGLDAGADAGAPDAGGPDAGCVPRDLTSACAMVECGFVSNGCGREVSCDKWCPGPQQCGVRAPNTCALPSLCTPEGWCWEHPLPQGLTLNGAFRLDARHTWFVGEHGVIVFFDGERMTLQQAPGADGASLMAVHGTALDEVFAVGANGTLLHFDGTAWEREAASSAGSHLRSVWSLGGGRALAVGVGARVLVRDPTQPASLRWRIESFPTTGAGELREVFADDEGRQYVVAFGSELFTRPAGSPTNWTRLDTVPLTGTQAGVAVGDGLLFGGASGQGESVVKRLWDGGWVPMTDAGLLVTELVRADGGVFALGGAELGWVSDEGRFTRFGAQGGQWNAGVPLDGPRLLAGGDLGAMALLSTDGGTLRLSSPRVLSPLNLNAVCGHGPGGMYALGGSEAATCAGQCQVSWLERELTTAGVRWVQRSLPLGNTTALRGCLSESPTRTWFTGNDSKFISRDLAGQPVAGDFATGDDVTSVWGQPDAGYVFARAGESSLLYSPTGLAPFVVQQNVAAPLRAVWGAGGDAVVAVGERLVARADNLLGPWNATMSTASLVAVHGAKLSTATTRFVAAGDTTIWSSTTGSVGGDHTFSESWVLSSTWVSRTGRAWVGGTASDGGALLLTSDVSAVWGAEPLSAPRPVRGVFGLDLDDGGVMLFVVGPSGMVLRR